MTMVSLAKEKVNVKYLEEMELVSVVAHLADVPGYNWDKQYVLGEYLNDVDSCFAPYKRHPAVEFVRRSSNHTASAGTFLWQWHAASVLSTARLYTRKTSW